MYDYLLFRTFIVAISGKREVFGTQNFNLFALIHNIKGLSFEPASEMTEFGLASPGLSGTFSID